MGLIREPLDVDFVVDPRPLTEKEKQQISEYIRAYKALHAKKHASKRTLLTSTPREKATA
ncbi:MAG: hypothetical protein A3H98_00580 [Bacteroidetes bacterium RIFCSPLOWO2_02_FULL_36_8]|nr:MAG: hypothetical protein A3H98_00580 [Bacteroidetes bacterium RIFCSPLOWO2_02_FULL_36_8]OFY69457.1 MAG: hypothetical protein A3G23_00650 [Bacteroidetes bacterium RIFCSPLOWO2_12_FULL_37_12]